MQKKSSSKGYDNPETAITLTPLCDVSLVLLIVLMIISPFIAQSLIRISDASAVAGRYADGIDEKPIFVHVKEEKVLVNTRPVKTDIEFAERIRNELQGRIDSSIMVTADKDVLLKKVIEVLDISKQNGAQSISIIRGRQ